MLATGAVALALASVPGVARAAIAGRPAAGRTTEPQSRPQEGRVLASLNGTWDFMPTTGTPTTPPDTGTWSSIPVPAEWNMTAGNFATAWGAYDPFETPANWNSVDVAWCRRTVDVPAGQRGQRIVLRFEAVNFEATVFFNGTTGCHAPSAARAGQPLAPGDGQATLVSDPTALVDPFIGTGSGGIVVGPVDMFPGASAPFGMLAWSPDTPSPQRRLTSRRQR